MKKSINLWAFPYPERMTLKECLQLAKDAGFDGIELNYDLDNDLSPKAGPQELRAVRKAENETLLVADGTSCRHQIHDGASRAALHVARLLEMSLDTPGIANS